MPFVISIINKCVIMKLFLVDTSFGKTMTFLDWKKCLKKIIIQKAGTIFLKYE